MKQILLLLLLGILNYSHAQSQTNNSFTETINGISFKMIKVEGGSFQMGSDLAHNEQPIHTVTLTDFYIAETEVTQSLWKAVMGTNPSENQNCEECPVDNVSWEDIVNEFLPKLEKLTGKKYHLPTEAQWEYAARGGKYSKNYTFAGSHDINQVAWYEENYQQNKQGTIGTTHPVKSKNPNELGLYDMAGNVHEWCQDWYFVTFYTTLTTATSTNPINDNPTFARVLRGGHWYIGRGYCHSTSRDYSAPEDRYNYFGLRLVTY